MEELEVETVTTTENIVEQERKVSLDDLPRLEDLLRSEKELNAPPALQGLKQVENSAAIETKTFTRKEDEHKSFVKKRLTVLTCVYTAVACLLFGFVCFNAITLAILNRNINNNTETIQGEMAKITEVLPGAEEDAVLSNNEPIEIIELTPARDYSDDEKELTFLDKFTILFKNLFG